MCCMVCIMLTLTVKVYPSTLNPLGYVFYIFNQNNLVKNDTIVIGYNVGLMPLPRQGNFLCTHFMSLLSILEINSPGITLYADSSRTQCRHLPRTTSNVFLKIYMKLYNMIQILKLILKPYFSERNVFLGLF